MRQQQLVVLALGLASQSVDAFSRKRLDEKSWTPARPTQVVNPLVERALGQGTSPRPTQAPRDLFGRMELQPRLDGYTLGPGTCGYVSSNGNSFTCVNSAATCDYDGEHMGCCLPNQDCTLVKTTCIDYSASAAGECDLPDDWNTLCCDNKSFGACYTWLFSTVADGDDELSTYSFLDCSARSGTGTLFDYDPAWSRTHIFESTTTTSSSETTSATDDDGGDDDDDDDGDSGGGSKTNVGAIAGGAVGGVAALGLVGVAAFLLLRRRKAKTLATTTDTQNPPPAHVASPGVGPNSPPPMAYTPTSPGDKGPYYPSGGYAPPSGSQSPQSYDPHMSMYSQQGGYYPQQGQQPQYGYQQQQPYQPNQPQPYPQQAYAGAYQPSSTGSPPPPSHTTPSPAAGHPPSAQGATSSSPAQELQAVNPVGMETNRAELG